MTFIAKFVSGGTIRLQRSSSEVYATTNRIAAYAKLVEIVLQGVVGYRKPSHFSARFLTVSQNPATKRIAFTIPEAN